jgi:hypothetical protein
MKTEVVYFMRNEARTYWNHKNVSSKINLIFEDSAMETITFNQD